LVIVEMEIERKGNEREKEVRKQEDLSIMT